MGLRSGDFVAKRLRTLAYARFATVPSFCHARTAKSSPKALAGTLTAIASAVLAALGIKTDGFHGKVLPSAEQPSSVFLLREKAYVQRAMPNGGGRQNRLSGGKY